MKRTWIILATWAMVAPVWATPEEADQSEERARASFIDQFTRFMQDKNIQGKAKRPDGSVAGGGTKNRFNADDGLPFQSDLTYHDFSFNSIERKETGQTDAQGQPKTEEKRLFAHVSNHGGVSAAGGSSVLERSAYALDQRFSEEDKQNKNNQDEEGVKFRSIFKITTREIFEGGEQPGGAAATNEGQPEEKDKVDRFELRDEARQEIEKVGAESAETILGSARGEENRNDPEVLGNGVLLRQAGYEATKALFYSTLGNLSQNRINRAIRSGLLPAAPQISEGVPRCDEWASVAQGVVSETQDPQQREKMLQDVQRMVDQCKQVASVRFDAINPNFRQQEGGQGGESLEFEGPQKENALQRDSRVQLELMAKAGKSISEIPANWEFTSEDEKTRMTIGFDDNTPREGSLSMRQQIESYNAQLQDAEDGYAEIQKRFPDLQMAKPTDYQIEPGTRHILEINQAPESAFEEVGIAKGVGKEPIPTTYEELLQNSQSD